MHPRLRPLSPSDQLRRSKGRRIGLLGGSFNPPHIGHLHLSREALKRLSLDEIWWILSPKNPLKSAKDLADHNQRLEACLKLITDPHILVTSFEFLLTSTYSRDTIEALQQCFRQKQLVWLLGADNLQQFDRWYAWQSISLLVPIAAFARPLSKGNAGASLKALRSPAANKLARYRRTKGTGHSKRLVACRPPAWSFFLGPQINKSSSQIRETYAVKPHQISDPLGSEIANN